MKNKFGAKNIFNIALFLLSVGLLAYFCISDQNLVTLFHSLPTLNLFWLIGALLSMAFNWYMDCQIIYLLVDYVYPGEYTTKEAFKITMVGQYFSAVTPFAIAGQPMQLIAFTRQGVASGIAISVLVRKFLVYQTSITLYSLFVILVKYPFFRSHIQGFMALAFIGFLCQAAVVIILVLFTYNRTLTTKMIHGAVWVLTKVHLVKNAQETSQKVQNQLQFYIRNNKAMQGNRKMKAKMYGYTVLQLTALFAVPFFLYKAFRNPGVPIINMISAQSFVTMISSYTPLPGAAGAAEGSFLVLFQMFFAPKIIKQAMLLWRLITYYSCVVVGIFFAKLGARSQKLNLLNTGEGSDPKNSVDGANPCKEE